MSNNDKDGYLWYIQLFANEVDRLEKKTCIPRTEISSRFFDREENKNNEELLAYFSYYCIQTWIKKSIEVEIEKHKTKFPAFVRDEINYDDIITCIIDQLLFNESGKSHIGVLYRYIQRYDQSKAEFKTYFNKKIKYMVLDFFIKKLKEITNYGWSATEWKTFRSMYKISEEIAEERMVENTDVKTDEVINRLIKSEDKVDKNQAYKVWETFKCWKGIKQYDNYSLDKVAYSDYIYSNNNNQSEAIINMEDLLEPLDKVERLMLEYDLKYNRKDGKEKRVEGKDYARKELLKNIIEIVDEENEYGMKYKKEDLCNNDVWNESAFARIMNDSRSKIESLRIENTGERKMQSEYNLITLFQNNCIKLDYNGSVINIDYPEYIDRRFAIIVFAVNCGCNIEWLNTELTKYQQTELYLRNMFELIAYFCVVYNSYHANKLIAQNEFIGELQEEVYRDEIFSIIKGKNNEGVKANPTTIDYLKEYLAYNSDKNSSERVFITQSFTNELKRSISLFGIEEWEHEDLFLCIEETLRINREILSLQQENVRYYFNKYLYFAEVVYLMKRKISQLNGVHVKVFRELLESHRLKLGKKPIYLIEKIILGEKYINRQSFLIFLASVKSYLDIYLEEQSMTGWDYIGKEFGKDERLNLDRICGIIDRCGYLPVDESTEFDELILSICEYNEKDVQSEDYWREIHKKDSLDSYWNDLVSSIEVYSSKNEKIVETNKEISPSFRYMFEKRRDDREVINTYIKKNTVEENLIEVIAK